MARVAFEDLGCECHIYDIREGKQGSKPGFRELEKTIAARRRAGVDPCVRVIVPRLLAALDVRDIKRDTQIADS